MTSISLLGNIEDSEDFQGFEFQVQGTLWQDIKHGIDLFMFATRNIYSCMHTYLFGGFSKFFFLKKGGQGG